MSQCMLSVMLWAQLCSQSLRFLLFYSVSWEDTLCLNVACCLSLPQKKTLLSIPFFADGVKCEDFWVET